MKDMVTSIEKLRADAAEAALIQEDHRLLPFNPYGRTKMFIEEILNDVAN